MEFYPKLPQGGAEFWVEGMLDCDLRRMRQAFKWYAERIMKSLLWAAKHLDVAIRT